MHKNSKQIRCRVVKQSDLIQNKIECRLTDVQAKLSDLLSAGYGIFDLSGAAAGFATLASQTAGNWVAIWKGGNSAAYDVALANITVHTNVVVILAEVNSANQVVRLINTQLNLATGDYANKLTVYGGGLTTGVQATPKNLIFENLAWTTTGASTYENLTLTNISGVLGADVTVLQSVFKQWTNVNMKGLFNLELQISVTNTGNFLTGVVFEALSRLIIKGLSAQKTFNFLNVMIKNFSDFRYVLLTTTTKSTFYYNTDNLQVTIAAAGPYWNQTGAAGFSSGSADYNCLEFDSNGILYAAYKDGGNSSKLTVMRFINGAWSVLTAAGVSVGAANYIGMVFDTNNNLYVAFQDAANSNYLTVMKWSGTNWSTIYRNTTDLYIVNGGISISFDGALTLILLFLSTGSKTRYVYMSTTGVVGLNYLHDTIICTEAWLDYYNNFALDSTGAINLYYYGYGTLMGHYAYTGYSGLTQFWYNRSYAIIKNALGWFHLIRLNGDATTTYLGTLDSPATTLVRSDCAIRFDGSDVYVAYKNSSSKITVKKYSGGVLTTLGVATFTAGNADNVALAVKASLPYIGYKDASVANKASVQKFDDASALTNTNFMFQYYKGNVYASKQVLNRALIKDDTAFFDVQTVLSPQNTRVSSIIGKTLRNGYRLSFDSQNLVDERLKQTGAEDYILRQYDDDSLIGKTLKNNQLFDSGMVPFDYQNNDNIMVIAVSASGKETDQIYYSKEWKRTRYADVYPNEAYVITHTYQILEVTENSDFVNRWGTITNSPLDSGSLTLNNYDNEVTQ